MVESQYIYIGIVSGLLAVSLMVVSTLYSYKTLKQLKLINWKLVKI